MTDIQARYEAARKTLVRRGQGHVLRWWPELSRVQRESLLADIESVPWETLDALIPTHVLANPVRAVPDDLSPPHVYRPSPTPENRAIYAAAWDRGKELLASGKVAALTVAGGQGSRLGVDGPKGMVPVTPISGRSLFQLFAEIVNAARSRYGAPIPWCIMTNPNNHGQTVAYFQSHGFFGLPAEDVVFFTQGMLPAFDFSGRLMMEARHRLAKTPDGNGGCLHALARAGALRDLRSRGIDIISYFQVDNPLVKPFDPLFIGLHAATGSEMSTKVTPKVDDMERVGNVCVHNGKLTIIEYFELPEQLARARNPDGSRRFNVGNLGIHLIKLEFADRVADASVRLPFRRAEKVVASLDEDGVLRTPATPNAAKLESFIADILPLARNPIVLEVDRAEEFSPVKNATGVDSLETARRDQIARACRWLESAGMAVPRCADGRPDVAVEISAAFALDAADVRANRECLPVIRRGDSVRIE